MKKKDYLLLFFFFLALCIFAIFSKKVMFHDTSEYITIAKYFAGINNVDLYVCHPVVYPFIISLFLKIYPTLLTIKLINILWIFLISLVLLIWLKNRRAFILFIFCPLVWYVGIQTTPILPASFFFFLSFIFLKQSKRKRELLYSGFFLGIACAIYTPMFLVAIFLLLIYFWDKKLSEVSIYILALVIGFLPNLIFDYLIFNIPFYTVVRHFGAQAFVSLGLNPAMNDFHIAQMLKNNKEVLLIFVVISPLLFKLIKIDFKLYKREIILISSIGLLFLIRTAALKYFFLILPIILVLLTKVLNKKEIIIHCILSLLLILLLTGNFFVPNQEQSIEKDLKNINQDFNATYAITDGYDALNFATFAWQNNPRFVWSQDYEASLHNQTYLRRYIFDLNSKIRLKDQLEFEVSFNRYDNRTYDNNIYIRRKSDLNQTESLKKCYEVLCVYE